MLLLDPFDFNVMEQFFELLTFCAEGNFSITLLSLSLVNNI